MLSRKHGVSRAANTLYGLRSRCNNKRNYQYVRYGKRGIRAFLTRPEIEYLWIRDKADTLEKPSIDRVDPKGNYTLENCRFIELTENIQRATKKDFCIRGHKLSEYNYYIKPSGKATCRKCKNLHDRVYRKRKKEKLRKCLR